MSRPRRRKRSLPRKGRRAPQDRLVVDAAHELRTPLTAIRTHLELIRANPDATLDDYRAMASALERTLARVERIVADMLLLATADRVPLNGEVALGPLLEEVALVLRPLAAAHQVTLHLRGEASALVAGDNALLTQVFSNLIENAIRYNHIGGEVVVTVDQEVTWAAVSVSDTGTGIPLPEQARIFERFYRSETTRAQHADGAGLGLAIVAQIVRRHGGQVQVVSAPGQGSRFVVRLPLAHLPDYEGAARLNANFMPAVLSSPQDKDHDRPLRRKSMAPTLLFIDDAPDINALLVAYFRQAGFNTLGARDGRSGLELARQAKPDLIVLDLGLPDIDGIEVCEQIRRESNVPIVMLTRRGDKHDRMKGFAAGADDYIVKPFDIEDVEARIRAVLRRAQQGPGA